MGSDRQNQAPAAHTPATLTPQFIQTRPFAPQIQPDLENDQEQIPDTQEQVESSEKFSLGKRSLFPEGTTSPLPPISQNCLQAKLTLGQPGDRYEQEADQMASQVVQRISTLKARPLTPVVQRQNLLEEEDEALQLKSIVQQPMVQRQEDGAVSADLETSIQGAKGSGQSMSDSVRQPMEQAFGADFSGVKIHTDSQSDQLNRSIQAKAFTTGKDVFFRQGTYDPGSQGGQELLAHELTHVVQQTGGQVAPIQKKGQPSKLSHQAPIVQAWSLFGESETPAQKAQKQQEWANVLENDKNAFAEQLSTEFTNKLKGELALAFVEGFKGNSSKWDAATFKLISSQVQAAAEAQVIQNMQRQGTDKSLSSNIVQDAQKYAKQYIGSGTFDAVFSDYAQKTVNNEQRLNLDTKSRVFRNIALHKLDAAKAKIGNLESVHKDAKELVTVQYTADRKNLKILIAELVQGNASSVAQELTELVSTKIGTTAGAEEVDKRQQADSSLLGADSATWLGNIYNQDIFKPLQVYLEQKFGGNGMDFWSFRSDEAHRFREAMKKAGRDQAYQEIGEKIHTVDQTKDKTVAGKDYYETKAKDYAYSLAKVSVNDQMKALAEAEVRDLLEEATQGKAKTLTQLEVAAKSSAYDTQRSGAKSFAKVGQTAAKMEALKIFAEKKDLAQKRKNEYFAKGAVPLRDTTQIKEAVTQKVTADEVSTKSIKQVVEADTLSQGLTKIGRLIDMSAANPGDRCSTKIQIKIPVYDSGAGQTVYVIIEFNGEAEREQDELTVSAELSLGAGFETWGLDANVQGGVALKAKGKSTPEVTNLLSYGAFRELKSKSESLAYKLWGGTSKRQDKAQDQNAAKNNAEQWASMIEEGNLKDVGSFDNSTEVPVKPENVNTVVYFEDSQDTIVTTEPIDSSQATPKDRKVAGKVQAIDTKHYSGKPRVLVNKGAKEAYVESGYLAKVGGEFNAGVAKGKGEAKFSALSRWTGNGEEKRKAVKLGGEAELALAGQKATLGLELSAAWTSEGIKAFELAAKGKVTAAAGEDLTKLEEIGVQYGTSAAAGLRNLIQTYKRATDKEEKAKGSKTASNVGSVLSDASGPLSQLEKGQELTKAFTSALGTKEETVNDTLASKFSGEEIKASKVDEVNKISSESALEVAVKISYDDSKWEFDISVAQVKTKQVDLGVFKAEVEKSQRLARLNVGKEGVKGGLLGIEKA